MNSPRFLALLAIFAGAAVVFAQPSAISVSITHPSDGTVNDDVVPVSTTITSTYEILSVQASVGVLQTNLFFRDGRWTNTLSVADQTNGSYVLTVTAHDVFGATNQSQRTIVVRRDGPPALTVLAPLHDTVVRANGVYVEATASDDVSSNCVISVIVQGTRLLSGTNRVHGTIFPAQSGIVFEAKDQSGQTASQLRTVVLEKNSNLVEVASAPARIVDFSSNSFLCAYYTRQGYRSSNGLSFSFTHGDPDYALVDRAFGTRTMLESPPGVREPGFAALTERGAFVILTTNWNMWLFGYPQSGFWDNGVWHQSGICNPVLDQIRFRRAGDFLSYLQYDLSTPEWRSVPRVRAINQTNELEFHGARNCAVAPNGDVFYNIDGAQSAIYRSRPVDTTKPFGARNVITLTDGPSDGSIETDGTNVVYGSGSDIRLWTPFGEHVISTNTGSFLINNGWVAFTRPGSAGQSQIWVRSPSGGVEQRTFFSGSSFLESLGPNGALTFTSSTLLPPSRYVSRPGATLFSISGIHGEPRWSPAGELFVLLGRSIFAVGAGSLRVLPTSSNSFEMAFSGPQGTVEVERSTDLFSWVSAGATTNSTGLLMLTNPMGAQREFFRLRLKP